jgi:hypothetical protein
MLFSLPIVIFLTECTCVAYTYPHSMRQAITRHIGIAPLQLDAMRRELRMQCRGDAEPLSERDFFRLADLAGSMDRLLERPQPLRPPPLYPPPLSLPPPLRRSASSSSFGSGDSNSKHNANSNSNNTGNGSGNGNGNGNNTGSNTGSSNGQQREHRRGEPAAGLDLKRRREDPDSLDRRSLACLLETPTARWQLIGAELPAFLRKTKTVSPQVIVEIKII